MIYFSTNSNIKCNFKVLVYLWNDNNYNLIISDERGNLKILYLINILNIKLFPLYMETL